jgi:hypothetical protein
VVVAMRRAPCMTPGEDQGQAETLLWAKLCPPKYVQVLVSRTCTCDIV